MNLSGTSNPRLGFSGIYGTATKVNKDGTKEQTKIEISGDEILEVVVENKNSANKVYLFKRGMDFVRCDRYEKDVISYKDFTIDKIDANSIVKITAPNSLLSIGTLKDNAKLNLNPAKKNVVNIEKIEGNNVNLRVYSGNEINIKGQSSFNLWSPKIYSDDDKHVKVSGSNLHIKV